MITIADLRKLARARLIDAQVLYNGSRYDAVVYFCGYVVEVALKARICRTLKWSGFPEDNKDFQSLQSFKTHDLNILLKLSGIEAKIKASYKREWSVVSN